MLETFHLMVLTVKTGNSSNNTVGKVDQNIRHDWKIKWCVTSFDTNMEKVFSIARANFSQH